MRVTPDLLKNKQQLSLKNKRPMHFVSKDHNK